MIYVKPEGLGLPSWEKVQIQAKYQAPSQANVWELTAPPLAGENEANGKIFWMSNYPDKTGYVCQHITSQYSGEVQKGEQGGEKLSDPGSHHFTLATALPQLHFWI